MWLAISALASEVWRFSPKYVLWVDKGTESNESVSCIWHAKPSAEHVAGEPALACEICKIIKYKISPWLSFQTGSELKVRSFESHFVRRISFPCECSCLAVKLCLVWKVLHSFHKARRCLAFSSQSEVSRMNNLGKKLLIWDFKLDKKFI